MKSFTIAGAADSANNSESYKLSSENGKENQNSLESSKSKASDGEKNQIDQEEDEVSLPVVTGFKDNIVSYKQYSDIMFYSQEADFAFVYPQKWLSKVQAQVTASLLIKGYLNPARKIIT